MPPLDWDDLRRRSLLPGGFGQSRADIWPQLLGVAHTGPRNASPTEPEPHRDERQIRLDTDRSFVLYPAAGAAPRESLQAQLNALLVSIFRARPKLNYFQGYHDIITVLFLTLPPELRLPCAEKLSLHRLRDSMGATLEPILGLLRIMKSLIRLADPSFADLLEGTSPLPFFALSNLLTLFAHDIPTLPLIQHVFDYLLARPPIAVVYLEAAILLVRKDDVARLAEEGEEGMMHSLLTALPELVDSPEEATGSTGQGAVADSPETDGGREGNEDESTRLGTPSDAKDNEGGREVRGALDVGVAGTEDTEGGFEVEEGDEDGVTDGGADTFSQSYGKVRLGSDKQDTEPLSRERATQEDDGEPGKADSPTITATATPEALTLLQDEPNLLPMPGTPVPLQADLNLPPSPRPLSPAHAPSSPPSPSLTPSRTPSPPCTKPRPPKLTLTSLLTASDALLAAYPPSHPMLCLASIMGPQSVVFTWCAEGVDGGAEGDDMQIGDDEAEAMVAHPELVVYPYIEETGSQESSPSSDSDSDSGSGSGKEATEGGVRHRRPSSGKGNEKSPRKYNSGRRSRTASKPKSTAKRPPNKLRKRRTPARQQRHLVVGALIVLGVAMAVYGLNHGHLFPGAGRGAGGGSAKLREFYQALLSHTHSRRGAGHGVGRSALGEILGEWGLRRVGTWVGSVVAGAGERVLGGTTRMGRSGSGRGGGGES